MKQVKVKKIKKIPKYSGGTGNAGTSVLNTIASSYTPFSGSISKAPAGGNLTGSPTITPGGKSTSNNYGGYSNTHIPSGLTTGANELIKSTFGIDQNSTAAVMMDSTAQGAELGMSVAGPWGALIGTGVGFALGAFKGDSIDYSKISTTSDIADSYVAGGIFGGGNKDKLLRDAAQYQNSLAATEMTANARNAWASDPRNQGTVSTLKDGGVVPDVVHAKVSKGELYYDPNNKKLSRVPGSPDKPNTDDNVDAFLAKGGIIITNNDKQPLINGKPQAMALAPMTDKPNKNMSKGTMEARDRIIKKVSRLNELSKKENVTDNIVYANVGDNDLGNNENELLNWLRKKTEGTVLGKTLNPPADGDNRSELEKVRDRMKRVRQGGSYFDDPYQFTFSPQSEFGNRNLEFTTDGVGGFKPTNKFGYLGPQSTRQLLYTPDISDVVVPNFDYTLKSTSQKTSANKSTPQTTTPTPSRAAWAYMHNPENPPLYVPEASLEPGKITNVIKPIRSKDLNTNDTENSNSDDNIKSTMNWEDLAYKAASILTPLFDREKAETTRLQRPTWHGIPVAVDVLNQLQDAQLGYALANYNTAQGGYTAGQQLAARGAAASNLARQRAQIHQWQTEQQNKNIAQNIASYNAHANVLAEIANKESDINAANRASARNINRQGRATALKNWGQIRRNEKQYAMDDVRMAALEPLLQYAYENPEQIKKLVNKAKR